MKLIIAGSRTFKNINLSHIAGFIQFYNLEITEVVCGGCYGVDSAGASWANFYDTKINVKTMLADWCAHGKAAGPIRNKEMAEYADALLLIWDGKSKGSSSMLKEMKKLNKPIYEVILK